MAEGGRSVDADAGLLLGLGFAGGGLRAFQIGGGHAQVGIGGQRLFHQSVQRRVVVQPPPASGRRVLPVGRLMRLQEGRLRVRSLDGGGSVR